MIMELIGSCIDNIVNQKTIDLTLFAEKKTVLYILHDSLGPSQRFFALYSAPVHTQLSLKLGLCAVHGLVYSQTCKPHRAEFLSFLRASTNLIVILSTPNRNKSESI